MTTTGFGFDIFKNDLLFIHQPNIPAIQGATGFKTAADAAKAANLMLNKIHKKIFPPSISKKELDSLKISN